MGAVRAGTVRLLGGGPPDPATGLTPLSSQENAPRNGSTKGRRLGGLVNGSRPGQQRVRTVHDADVRPLTRLERASPRGAERIGVVGAVRGPIAAGSCGTASGKRPD